MIICMNYSDDGISRYIARIEEDHGRWDDYEVALANAYKVPYDEVYIIPFEATKDLISEVVLKGCRI